MPGPSCQRGSPLRGAAALATLALGVGVAGCGAGVHGSGGRPAKVDRPSHTGTSAAAAAVAAAASAGAITARPVAPPGVAELGAAEHPARGEFPSAARRSLIALAKLVGATASLGAANGNFTPGPRRYAFALTNKAERFIYAPTAVYLAATPTSPAEGPFLAPADPMAVSAAYRSAQNTGPGGLGAIYFTELPLPRSGVFDVLSLTRAAARAHRRHRRDRRRAELADPRRRPAPP